MLTVQHLERKATHGKAAIRPPEGLGLVVEFAGPTGTGKTTNCRHFSETLINAGFKVCEFRDVKNYLYGLSPVRRFDLYLRTIFRNSGKLSGYCRLLAANGIFHPDALIRYVKLCIFNTAAQEFMKSRRADVLLLDQWVVQGLWSATIFRAKAYAPLQQQLPRFYFDTSCLLFFDADEETACRRIASRAFGRSRFDRMDPSTRLEEMKRYNAYLRTLFDNSPCSNKLFFSTRQDPQQNAEDFLKYLQTVLHPKIQ